MKSGLFLPCKKRPHDLITTCDSPLRFQKRNTSFLVMKSRYSSNLMIFCGAFPLQSSYSTHQKWSRETVSVCVCVFFWECISKRIMEPFGMFSSCISADHLCFNHLRCIIKEREITQMTDCGPV